MAALIFSILSPRVALAATATEVASEAELRAAVGQGSAAGNIKLTQDIRLSRQLDLGGCAISGSDGNVTIDLAGRELSYPRDYRGSAVVVPPGYALTLRDSGGRNAGCVTGAERGVENHGTFTLTSGSLRNNNGPCDGNGLYNAAGGVATITGGIIESNGSEEGHSGAGIYNVGTLQLTGGMVRDNLTDPRIQYEGRGGGIYNGPRGNLTISGGTIQGNHADYGGGLYNDPACDVCVVMGRVKMTDNLAVIDGGGIYNGKTGDGVKLALLGGVISQNTAGGKGGGIANLGTMAASAGTVSKNVAGSKGGGIYVEGPLALSGAPVVRDNTNGAGLANDCHLVRDVSFTIEDALTAKANIGIVCEDSHQVFTSGYDQFNAIADGEKFFFANPNDRQSDVRIMAGSGYGLGELRCVIVIHYLDVNGTERECIEYEDVSSDSWGDWGEETWLVAREDTTINDDIGVRGNVNLILCADKTLRTEYIGVRRNNDSDKTRAVFTIYNSTGVSGEGYGNLIADGHDSSSAGIGYKANSGGVGTIIINGGDIKAYGGGDAAGIGGVENRGNGPITINGGKVYAEGGKHGTGIGAGQGGDQDNPINIYGGEVEAHGGRYAAGIGGGDSDNGGADGGEVRIYDAIVRAYGGDYGAGIGGGEDGQGGDVTIRGNANVYAQGGDFGPGIGGGQDSNWGGTLVVRGGYVEARGGEEAAGIGGGEDSCGGSFIAEGGTIIAAAGKNCATAIGAGHGDYHEGSKSVYDTAMVHAGDSPDASNYRIMAASERVAACGWHYVRIEPCDHQGASTYADKDHQVHSTTLSCAYCVHAEGAHDEAHRFDAGSHACVCGHKEIPIVLKYDESTQIETTYASEGSSYLLRSVRPRVEDKYFSGWKVSGLSGTADGTVLGVGMLIPVEPARASDPITLEAQWTDEHTHGLSYHAAQEPSCTEDGNVEYWVCDQQVTGSTRPCGACFVRAAEGEASKVSVEMGGETVRLKEVDQEAVIQRALGHDWSETTYEWAAGNASCTASHSCQRSGCGQTESETATQANKQLISWTHTATCTKAQQTLLMAVFKTEGFEAQNKNVVEGEPLGHDWKEPSYAWSDDLSTCTAARVCARDASHVETETVETSWTTEQATCTKAGVVTYTADFGNEAFASQTIRATRTEPRAHDWGEPTYAWTDEQDGGKTCTATRVCAHDASHVQTEGVRAQEFDITAATCTKPGEKAYRASFATSGFAPQITTIPVQATGHAWGAWQTVEEATSTEPGLERRICGNDPTHVQERAIPIAGHTHSLTKVEETAPTCLADGNIAYWVCDGEDGCGRFFSDGGGLTEIDESDIVPAAKRATGHAWQAPTYAWTADGGSVVASRRCAHNLMHVQMETGKVTEVTLLKASCTTGGLTQRIATFTNAAFVPQAQIVATEPLGHDWGAWVVTKEATESEKGVESRSCVLCGGSETRDVPAKAHQHQLTKVAAVEPTCTEAGSVEHWVCRGGSEPCGRAFSDAEGTQELAEQDLVRPALGHDWGEVTYAWADGQDGGKTCTATRRCARDASHVETETAQAQEFVLKASTCSEPGETAWRASFANSTFGSRVTTAATPATGHAWGDWQTVKEAISTEPGLRRRTCQNDPTHVEERAVPPTGHVHRLTKVEETEPTCLADGNIAYWVCDGEDGCGACFKDEDGTEEIYEETMVPADKRATGHKWNDPSYAWSQDGCTVLALRSCAHNPLHFQMEAGKVATVTLIKPGCTTGGLTQRIATFENAAFTPQVRGIAVDPLGHAWDEWTRTREPSCTEDGVEARTCERDASHREIRAVPALGHDWGPWVLTREATQSEDGEETRTCSRCDGTETRTVPAGTHVHQMTLVDAVAPSCTETGSIAHWLCEGGSDACGRFFADPEGAVELTARDIELPALGHDWGAPTYAWSDDNATCTATRVCTRDASHVETETVDVTETVVTEASCTAGGQSRLEARFSNEAFSAQAKTVQTASKGHEPASSPRREEVVPATCDTPGSYDAVTYCSTCKAELSRTTVTIAALGHDWGEWSQTTAPTCTGDGVETRVCENDASHVQTRPIDALGHDWGPWKVEKTQATEGERFILSRSCGRAGCGETQRYDITAGIPETLSEVVEVADPEPVLPDSPTPDSGTKALTLHVLAKSPSCTEPGNVEYWVRAVTSGGVFTFLCYVRAEDGASYVVTEPSDLIVPATGHSWDEGSYTEGKEPTCTLEGERTRRCQNGDCGATKTEPVDPLGHLPIVLTLSKIQEPGCETAGFAWSVRGCARCKHELSRSLVKTEPLGHDWGAWEETRRATESEPGEMKRVCAHDAEHVETLVIPALDHDWSAPTYSWSDDFSTCTATRVCKLDPTHVETEVVRAGVMPGGLRQLVEVVESFPGCEVSGQTIYTAWFVNPAFLPQTKEVATNPLGHSWGNWTQTTEPTCTGSGLETRTCTRDSSHVETRETSALGHAWGDWVVTREPTETEEGIETRTCARCGVTETRSISKVVPGEIAYRCVTGELTWTRGSEAPAVFTFKRSTADELTFAHFRGVKVDGSALDAASYDAASGSVVVSLRPAYLETLATGEYRVEAIFDDGASSPGTLVVVEQAEKKDDADAGNQADVSPGGPVPRAEGPAASLPETGETSWAALAVCMALVGVIFLAVAVRMVFCAQTLGHDIR